MIEKVAEKADLFQNPTRINIAEVGGQGHQKSEHLSFFDRADQHLTFYSPDYTEASDRIF